MKEFRFVPQPALRVLITCVVPPTLGSDVISSLIHVMRDRCAGAQMAGLMVFDGGQMIHLLEGESLAVDRIATTLLEDVRFDERRLRLRTRLVDHLLLPERFQVTYPGEQDQGGEGLLDHVFACEGSAAFDALLQLLPRLDRDF